MVVSFTIDITLPFLYLQDPLVLPLFNGCKCGSRMRVVLLLRICISINVISCISDPVVAGMISSLLIDWFRFRLPTVEGQKYTIDNPLVVLRKRGQIRLTDGTVIDFNEENKQAILQLILLALENGIRFGTESNHWRLDCEQSVIRTPQGIHLHLKHIDRIILAETFLYDTHFVDFDLAGKTVIDAGAFTGDTALYFASKGARVYSFEPDPDFFETARRNMQLNEGLAKNITLNNWAIGVDGEIPFNTIHHRASKKLLRDSRTDEIVVKSMSIAGILEKFKIEHPFLLHLDIKGQEFEAIKDEAIAKFSRVRIEYSTYLKNSNDECEDTLDMLLTRLEKYGFHHVRLIKHNYLRFDLSAHGVIDAMK